MGSEGMETRKEEPLWELHERLLNVWDAYESNWHLVCFSLCDTFRAKGHCNNEKVLIAFPQ